MSFSNINLIMTELNLQALAKTDKFIINQKMDMIEIAYGDDDRNQYSVRDGAGVKLFCAVENSSFCARHCCGKRRPYTMIISDISGKEVIHLYRPLKCQSCCFPCCLQHMEVNVILTNFVAHIYQRWKCGYPSFIVVDNYKDIVLRIEGPFSTTNCCGHTVVFKIFSGDGNYEVGEITKDLSGFLSDVFSNVDTFGVTFPLSLDVNLKAVMLGACFLINCMYFDGPEM